MYYFCSYLDHHYLTRGLALYESLRRYCPSFRLWLLCLSQSAYETMLRLKLPDIFPIAMQEFENGDTELQMARQNRSLLEYYFTCTPSLSLFVFRQNPQVDLVTYLDSDLFFFHDPEQLFCEMGNASVALIAHRFSSKLIHLFEYGTYNVGFLSFRRDSNALECLQWWRNKCLEWCHDWCEDGRFADQKYLDEWPSLFKNIAVLQNKGGNLAPWNVDNYRVWVNSEEVWVDDQPLVFYHFQGLKQLSPWIYDINFETYDATATSVIRRRIYGPYIQALKRAEKQVSSRVMTSLSRGDDENVSSRKYKLCSGIWKHHYLVFWNGKTL